MNKRSFLKATGVTFVASLFAAPFLGRRDSEANAQEGGDLVAQIEALRKQLQNETDERKADSAAIRRSLEASFIGTVTAIASNKIPYGWHLCDGTPIPDTTEFKLLKDLTGLTHFPDYRGVFLRGLDEKTQDGTGDARGFDPNRTLDGQVQESANLKHSHGAIDEKTGNGVTEPGGKHNHQGNTNSSEHSHGNPNNGAPGGVKKSRFHDVVGGEPLSAKEQRRSDFGDRNYPHACFEISGGSHSHPIPMENNHAHVIAQSGGAESRPRNVAVRYIIKFM